MAQALPVDDICRLIDAQMIKGYLNIDTVARMLGRSTRTFQRLLQDQGLKIYRISGPLSLPGRL